MPSFILVTNDGDRTGGANIIHLIKGVAIAGVVVIAIGICILAYKSKLLKFRKYILYRYIDFN